MGIVPAWARSVRVVLRPILGKKGGGDLLVGLVEEISVENGVGGNGR